MGIAPVHRHAEQDINFGTINPLITHLLCNTYIPHSRGLERLEEFMIYKIGSMPFKKA